MSLDKATVGVVGAGAMGSGIAQVAAAAGHRVIIGDALHGATGKARASISKALDREVEKKKLSRDDADALLERITFTSSAVAEDLSAFRHCGLVIEAIVEDLPAKRRLFHSLEGVVAPDAVEKAAPEMLVHRPSVSGSGALTLSSLNTRNAWGLLGKTDQPAVPATR